jgi:hypothetical protein
MGRSSTMAKIALLYGVCSSLAACATLLLMAGGSQSPLGQGIALLALSVFWTGVPLLPLSVRSLKGRAITRLAGFAVLSLSFAPVAICLFCPIAKVFVDDGMRAFAIAPSIVPLLVPVAISLTLLLLLISRSLPEKGAS